MRLPETRPVWRLVKEWEMFFLEFLLGLLDLVLDVGVAVASVPLVVVVPITLPVVVAGVVAVAFGAFPVVVVCVVVGVGVDCIGAGAAIICSEEATVPPAQLVSQALLTLASSISEVFAIVKLADPVLRAFRPTVATVCVPVTVLP
jgi:hypothetical protein